MKTIAFIIIQLSLILISQKSYAQDSARKIRKVEKTILTEYERTQFGGGVKKVIHKRSVYLVSVVKLPTNSSGDMYRTAFLKAEGQVLEFLNPGAISTENRTNSQETEKTVFINGEKKYSETNYTRNENNGIKMDSYGQSTALQLLTVLTENDQKTYIFYKKSDKK